MMNCVQSINYTNNNNQSALDYYSLFIMPLVVAIFKRKFNEQLSKYINNRVKYKIMMKISVINYYFNKTY